MSGLFARFEALALLAGSDVVALFDKFEAFVKAEIEGTPAVVAAPVEAAPVAEVTPIPVAETAATVETPVA